MYRTITSLVGIVSILWATTAQAQFLVDLDAAQLRKVERVVALEDLAIEETGIVTLPRLCVTEGALFISNQSVLDDRRSEYGLSLRVQRKQGNAVTVEGIVGDKSKTPLKQALLKLVRFAVATDCEATGVAADRKFSVLSINDAKSAKDLVSQ